MRKRGLLIVSALVAVIVLAGCGPDADGEDLPLESEDSPLTVTTVRGEHGLVGIPFRNGIECLGENARPLASDAVYVSPEGADDNAGTSPDTPLGSLAWALCNLRPGQTLYVLPGTYRDSVILGVFGDPGATITIQGVIEDGRRPVLDGENVRSFGLVFSESMNITIENLEFGNYTDAGLYVLLGKMITVRNNRFVDNGRASTDPDSDGEGFGLNLVGVTGALVEKNEADGNGPEQERWEKWTLGTGINTYELFDSIVRENHIHHTIGGGILIEDGGNVLVEDNLIEQNELDANGDYWDGGIWVDGSVDIILRRNTIRDNHGPGVVLSDEDLQYPTSSRGYRVENNLISGNLFGIYIWNFGQCPAPETAIRLLQNQIENSSEKDLWCQR